MNLQRFVLLVKQVLADAYGAGIKASRTIWRIVAELFHGIRGVLGWWGKLFKDDPVNAITALAFTLVIVVLGYASVLRVVYPKKILIIAPFEIVPSGDPRIPFGGRAASNLLADETKQLVDESTSYMAELAKENVEKPTSFIADLNQETIHVGVEIGGLSAERLESELAKLRYDQKVVTGDLLLLQEGAKLRVRIDNNELVEAGPFRPNEREVTEAFRQVGTKILADFYPLIGGALYQKNKDVDNALAVYERWTKQSGLSSKERSRAYFYLGVAWHLKQNPEASIDAFSSALKLDSQFSQAAANLAFEYYEINKIDGAIAAYERALGLTKENPATWLHYGNCLIAKHRYADAVAAYRETTKLVPKSWLAHSNLATALSKNGNGDEAVREKELAETLKPTN
jgi:tetratricopeptide (TPR) repeat protein